MHKRYLRLAKSLQLPVDALMQPIALMGNRGAGKTYTGTKLFELAHALEVQCVAVDPIGKWWALRLGRGGRGDGLANVFIFGGKRGDFPLLFDQGAFIARLLVEKRIHAVLDVSLMRKGDRKRFIADFAEEFYLRKKQEDHPHPSVLFFEESHAFAPQKPQKGEERMLGALEDIVTEGRNAGIGCVIIDQRAARVNKNCLAMVEILVAMKTIHNLDRAAIRDWVVQKTGDVDLPNELPALKPGEAFIYAPAYDVELARIRFEEKETFDSSATAKVGEKRAAIGKLTPVDQKAIASAMQEAVTRAEQDNPAALRKRIADLEVKVRQAEAHVSVTSNEEARELRERIAGLEQVIAQQKGDAREAAEQVTSLMESLRVVAGVLKVSSMIQSDVSRSKHSQRAVKVEHRVTNVEPPSFFPPANFRRPPTEGGDLTPGMLRILDVLYMRQRPLTRKQLATQAIMTVGGGTFTTYLPKLKRLGLLGESGGMVELTPEGSANCEVRGVRRMPSSPEARIAEWRDIIRRDHTPGMAKLFDACVDAGERGLSREELATQAGMTVGGGTFTTYLPKLKRLGVIEEEGRTLRLAREILEG